MKLIDYPVNGRLNIMLHYLVCMNSCLILVNYTPPLPPKLKSFKISQTWKVTATDSERRSDFIWIKQRTLLHIHTCGTRVMIIYTETI